MLVVGVLLVLFVVAAPDGIIGLLRLRIVCAREASHDSGRCARRALLQVDA